MMKPDFKKLYFKHCKFKLMSGKEIFGVLWEENNNAGSAHYFASLGELLRNKSKVNDQRNALHNYCGSNININEIVYAEPLVN